MKLLTMLGAILVPMLGSAVAFLLYVPVITILSALAIGAGLFAAFGLGFTAGRGRFEAARASGRSLAKVIHIDRAASGAGIATRPSI